MKRIVAKFPGKCSTCRQPIAVGQEIMWASRSPSYHVECPKGQGRASAQSAKPAEKGDITIHEQGHHGQLRRISKRDPRVVKVVAVCKFWTEDGLSMGLSQDEGYVYTLSCRLATDEERAVFEEKEAQDAAREAERLAARDKAAAEAKARQEAFCEARATVTAGLSSTSTFTWAILDTTRRREQLAHHSEPGYSAALERTWTTDGMPVVIERFYAGDDDRVLLWAPQSVIEQSWAAHYAARPFPREEAVNFLAKYSQCVGADFYRWCLDHAPFADAVAAE